MDWVQEEWVQEHARLARACEEWESRLHAVEKGLKGAIAKLLWSSNICHSNTNRTVAPIVDSSLHLLPSVCQRGTGKEVQSLLCLTSFHSRLNLLQGTSRRVPAQDGRDTLRILRPLQFTIPHPSPPCLLPNSPGRLARKSVHSTRTKHFTRNGQSQLYTSVPWRRRHQFRRSGVLTPCLHATCQR